MSTTLEPDSPGMNGHQPSGAVSVEDCVLRQEDLHERAHVIRGRGDADAKRAHLRLRQQGLHREALGHQRPGALVVSHVHRDLRAIRTWRFLPLSKQG
eukprot:1442882-Rhodomonas_salina.3